MQFSEHSSHRVLNHEQKEQFLRDGFVRIEEAFSTDTAAAAREILWRATGCDPDDKTTWTRPVVRLGDFAQEPFRQAVNSPVLHAAFDELVGPGRWIPRQSLGGFPVRFPHPNDPGDTGWHIDASFPPPEDPSSQNYLKWHVNLRSRGRALLMLFLFSDVSENDAPTRIRVGSHLRVPALLAPAGDKGLPLFEICAAATPATSDLPDTLATGAAGTVYLCHPFLLHAAQPHHGKTPRFLAQPPLVLRTPFELRENEPTAPLVEAAILLGLNRGTSRS
ncbi:phytanoyl-CoA dioxygenase family protein [Acidobacteria bacterium AB60]|nr:phytanoyl-CoA dioxygenase family protein [Acidobacteria bacterium AB60]